MSLKAKIEAVIYAAEEPVTLAQLVSLLGLEAQAELDRVTSAQHSLQLEPDLTEDMAVSAEPDPNREIFESHGVESKLQASDLQAGISRGEEEARTPEVEQQTSTRPPESSTFESRPGQTDTVSGPAAPSSGPIGREPVSESAEGTAGPKPADNPKQTAREERERARALRDFLRRLLEELVRDYATSDRGLEIREVAGGFRLATKPEYHDAVRGFVKSLKPPLKLSLQSLETLAVVAYKQPVTAPEVSEIRGVDSGGVLGSLMGRKLVTMAGRKQVIGRPILYKTTKDFLLRFGLKDINELPSIEEFEKMAGELADNEPVQEEISMSQQTSAESAHTDPELARSNQSIEGSITGADLEEERDATEPQADGDGATVESVTPDGRLPGILPRESSLDDTNTSASEAKIQHNESQE